MIQLLSVLRKVNLIKINLFKDYRLLILMEKCLFYSCSCIFVITFRKP